MNKSENLIQSCFSPRGGGAELSLLKDCSLFRNLSFNSKSRVRFSYEKTIAMRKYARLRCAFTLAEVLVSLAIIGIVAALTLPTLMTNIENQKWKRHQKVVQGILTEANKLMIANDSTYGAKLPLSNCNNNVQCIEREISKAFNHYEPIPKDSITAAEKYTFGEAEDSIWDKDDIVYTFRTNNGVIYGVKKIPAPSPIFTLVADINGSAGPNENGKDLCTYIISSGYGSKGLSSGCMPIGSTEKDCGNPVYGFTTKDFNAAMQEYVTGNQEALNNRLSKSFNLVIGLDGPDGGSLECVAQYEPQLLQVAEQVSGTKCRAKFEDGKSAPYTDQQFSSVNNMHVWFNADAMCLGASTGGGGGGGGGDGEENLCLAKGTLITLADGSQKPIENISYDDEILVWDFDNGNLATTKPLWIKKKETTNKYNLLTFENGTQLKTIVQHRIFNKELGKYTYPMTDETPIGTTTLLSDGTETKLIKKEVVEDTVDFYNIITATHFNYFANGISTSNRFNNLYHIQNYKFVKDDREFIPYENSEFKDIVDKEFYTKARLGEIPKEFITKDYLIRLQKLNSRSLCMV